MSETVELKNRPKIDARQQVAAMKKKGIKFELSSESAAEKILRERNYYFKLKAYAKLFDRYTNANSQKLGQYINLDFEYLVELSRLDKALRFTAMETALDIEHFMKVQMNAAMMDDAACDAYSIVSQFLEHDAQMKLSRVAQKRTCNETIWTLTQLRDHLTEIIDAHDDESQSRLIRELDAAKDTIDQELDNVDLHHIEKSISRLSNSQYSRKLANKYGRVGQMAYWHFMELATFGDIIGLYKYYFIERGRSQDATVKRVKQLLFPIRMLRNAAAHNSCLLNTLRDKLSKPLGSISKTLIDSYRIDTELVQLTKRIPLIHDFSALLICYDILVKSERSRNVCSERLAQLERRIAKNLHYFSKQSEIYKSLKMLLNLLSVFAERFGSSQQIS